MPAKYIQWAAGETGYRKTDSNAVEFTAKTGGIGAPLATLSARSEPEVREIAAVNWSSGGEAGVKLIVRFVSDIPPILPHYRHTVGFVLYQDDLKHADPSN